MIAAFPEPWAVHVENSAWRLEVNKPAYQGDFLSESEK
jgi:hypothetical protein